MKDMPARRAESGYAKNTKGKGTNLSEGKKE